jgi:hypothetical protein
LEKNTLLSGELALNMGVESPDAIINPAAAFEAPNKTKAQTASALKRPTRMKSSHR